jgi:hypothetical protein
MDTSKDMGVNADMDIDSDIHMGNMNGHYTKKKAWNALIL